MPITVMIPDQELFDQKINRFLTVKGRKLSFEHSLLSISKWESIWHKPYLSTDKKTDEETYSYLACMCLDKDVNPLLFRIMDRESIQKIVSYIDNPMTATTFREDENKKNKREIITNEIVYYWMTELNIPFDPCQKWHFNHLMTLIKVASIKKQPPKKMGKKEWASQRAALNAQRRAKYHTSG